MSDALTKESWVLAFIIKCEVCQVKRWRACHVQPMAYQSDIQSHA